MQEELEISENVLSIAPIDVISQKLQGLSSKPYYCLEMAHHRVSGFNIFIRSGQDEFIADHDESHQGVNLFDALVSLITGGGEDAHPYEEVNAFSERYRSLYKQDPFIQFSNAIDEAISAHPFFYVCLETVPYTDEWKLNLSLNVHKEKSFRPLVMNHNLTIALESATVLIKEGF